MFLEDFACGGDGVEEGFAGGIGFGGGGFDFRLFGEFGQFREGL